MGKSQFDQFGLDRERLFIYGRRTLCYAISLYDARRRMAAHRLSRRIGDFGAGNLCQRLPYIQTHQLAEFKTGISQDIRMTKTKISSIPPFSPQEAYI